MKPVGDVVVGSKVTLTFTYVVGPKGMKKGGSLRITTPNDAWSFPMVPMHRHFLPEQLRKGKDGGYYSYARCDTTATVTTRGQAWVDLSAEQRASLGKLKIPGNAHIVATVRDGDLAPGDVITVVYGDTHWGEEGATVARVVSPPEKDHFRAFVDAQGKSKFVELPSESLKKLRVVAGPPTHFNIVAPASVRPGQPFVVKFAATDAYHNRPTGQFVGKLRLSSRQSEIRMPGTLELTAANSNRAELAGVVSLSEGVHRIYAESEDGGERWVSNPIWCTQNPANLYFGDLHVHGKYHSDSIGTPAELYEYGRNVAGLDFMGVTDSWGYHKPQGWPETMAATRKYYEPGRFVTFKGFEYGYEHGHRNIIYRDCEDEPELAKLPINNVQALFKYYRGKNVISIPHHTKVWTDWQYYDPVLEPIVEIYSAWGSGAERVDPLWHKAIKPGSGVYTALARGYRVGFIGSGDSHSGAPGRSCPADRFWCVNAKSGFACVYAPELTREAVFDALRERRCYATTGTRMILEFSVNGVRMGGETTLASVDTPRRISVHVIGTDLDHLRIIKNNQELVRKECTGDEAWFEVYDTAPAKSGDFYYVRVVQQDENTAWSSPVWMRMP